MVLACKIWRPYSGILIASAPMKLRVCSWLILVAVLVALPTFAQQAPPPAIERKVDHLAAEEMASLPRTVARDLDRERRPAHLREGLRRVRPGEQCAGHGRHGVSHRLAFKVADCHCSDAARRRAQARNSMPQYRSIVLHSRANSGP